MQGKLNEPRYLIGAIVCAVLIEKYLSAIAPFLQLDGKLSGAAAFFCVTLVLLLYKIIDLNSAEPPDDSASTLFDFVFALILLGELAIFLKIPMIFTKGVATPATADSCIPDMYVSVAAIYILDMIYQFLATLRRASAGDGSKLLTEAARASLTILSFAQIRIEDRQVRSLTYLGLGAICTLLYLVGWAITGGKGLGLLVVHAGVTLIYTRVWLIHRYNRRMDAAAT